MRCTLPATALLAQTTSTHRSRDVGALAPPAPAPPPEAERSSAPVAAPWLRPPDALGARLAAAVLQRTVDGIGDVGALKADAQAWNTFLLLDAGEQTNFQNDVGDTTKDVSLDGYVAKARVSGRPVLEAWFGANAATIAGTAPGRIEVGLQDVADYGFPELLRFYWFGLVGPQGPRGSGAKVKLATFGINLHRGPSYSGLGHAWCKIGPKLSFEFVHNLIPAGKPAIVAALEGHAAGDGRAKVRGMANNANCF